jgi:methylmalonyl-CoA/ethylmalonyl-CoA epimerase
VSSTSAAVLVHHADVISDIDLDHVAVAAERQVDAWPRYAGDLAGAWVAGGDSVGFRSAQVRFANGMKVEVLEPHDVAANDFLRRFLDANGAGPHHLTFKVGDLDEALAAAEAARFQPVGVDRSDPGWQEAFLHPKQALGIVVQLAQSGGTPWESERPAELPEPATDEPATFEHLTHAVASLDDGAALFGALLGGREVGSGSLDGGRYLDLAWPGPGRVRLVAPEGGEGSPWAVYLQGRPGRLHHLAFRTADPARVPGAVPARDGSWVVAPERNLGVRLVLRAA